MSQAFLCSPRVMSGRYYDNDQLAMFKTALDEAVAELQAEESPLVASEILRLTRIRLAMAIFQAFSQGSRDPAKIKQTAIALVHDGRIAPRLPDLPLVT